MFNNLIELSKRGNTVTEQNVDYALSLSFTENDGQILEIDKDIILPDHIRQAGEAKDAGAEALCGCYPQEDDCVRHRTGRHRKDVSCHGHGYPGV